MKISDFQILSGKIEKYKPALNKSVSSQDNSYCIRLEIVLLAMNIGKLQPLLLSSLHFATTSSHYNTPCITPFSFSYYFQYLCANYWHLLLF